MIKRLKSICAYTLVALAVLFSPYGITRAQDENRAINAAMATERMLINSDPRTIDPYIDNWLSAAYRSSMPVHKLREHLQTLQAAVRGAGGVEIARENSHIFLIFSAGAKATVMIRMAEDEPGKIAFLGLKAEKMPGDKTPGEQQNDAIRRHVRGLELLAEQRDDHTLKEFAAIHLDPDLQNTMAQPALFAMLRRIGKACAAAGDIILSEKNAMLCLSLRGSVNIDVLFSIDKKSPFLINQLSIEEAAAQQAVSVAPISWQNLNVRLQEEEKAGFCGTVLIVRNGQIVLHQSYGLADRSKQIDNTTETVYGIGSTPIDFTRAAILKLQDDDRLDLSDPITRFFSGVPSDKKAMTIGHLMTGRSGLPNYHHDPDKDADYDLTWINREEAVNRILNARLLFTPGSERSHSHSAFVLLAAVVEVVSEMTYSSFLHRYFFEPIGMPNTGFYGTTSGFTPDQLAVGYGSDRVGEPNIPLNWGTTSWLIMGSGGMVSTPGDMYRWLQAIHEGDLLSTEAKKYYGRGNVYEGGSDRGFLLVFIDDPHNTVILSSNVHQPSGDHPGAVAKSLIGLFEENSN